jgi:hypothetical protein
LQESQEPNIYDGDISEGPLTLEELLEEPPKQQKVEIEKQKTPKVNYLL